MGSSLHTLIRDLHRRRGRERRGLALAEGVRLVEEAVAAGVDIQAAVVSHALEGTDRGMRLKAALVAAGVAVTDIPDGDLTELAATDQPQGVICVLRPAARELPDIPIDESSVVVILDAVQDPGNVGTIIRTALAFGAAGVIALPGTAEWTNPKTLRATMGAAFRLPVVAAPEEAVAAWLSQRRATVVATDVAGQPFDPAAWPRPIALVLGNEGAGARSALAAAAQHRVTIPVAPGVESLNVAVAAGILLHGVAGER
jgi:TrmH family RNA methyltransferase